MTKVPPKQQVLLLLEQCLATGIRGRVAEIVKHAKEEIEGRAGIDDLYCRQASQDVAIGSCPGLILKVGKHRRRWICRYTPAGARSTKQRTLGYFPEVSVAQAQTLWQTFKQQIDGNEAQPSLTGPTMAELVARYGEYARSHRKAWRQERDLLERWVEICWQERDPLSITLDDIEHCLTLVGEQAQQRGGHGQRAKAHALTLLRHFFALHRGKLAADLQQYACLPSNWADPCEGLSVSRVTLPTVPIQPVDLVRYQKALMGLPLDENIKPLLLLQLSLLTPFSALCRLVWQGVDLDKAVAWSQDQQGQPVLLPLTAAAVKLLRQQRRNSGGSPWVFPAPAHSEKPMPHRYPSQLMAAIRQHTLLSDQFTAERVARYGRRWLRQQGRDAASGKLPLPGAAITQATVTQCKEDLHAWQQHLVDLRLSL
ncbi:integrase family protein [Ferrimonas pelagia]|uniref:Integrase DNA-binding domain-containing protein n=1 Tax=Ferrimonas pelagia TaxID=1177826 RepID=A0ABP9EMJ0_9GAMM